MNSTRNRQHATAQDEPTPDFSRSRRSWLVTAAWLGIAAAGAAGVLGITRQAREQDMHTLYSHARLAVDTATRNVDGWIDRQYGALEGISANVSVQLYVAAVSEQPDSMADSAEASFLANLVAATAIRAGFMPALPPEAMVNANVAPAGAQGIAIVDTNNRIIAATRYMPALSGALEDFLNHAPRTGRSMSGPVESLANGEPVLFFQTPIFAVQAEPSAEKWIGRVVAVRAFVPELAELLKMPAMGSGAETLVVRRDGSELTFISPLGDDSTGRRMEIRPGAEPAEALALAAGGTVVEGRDYRFAPVFSLARSLTHAPWAVVRNVEQKAALAPSRSLQQGLWAGYGLSMALLFAILAGLWRHASALRSSMAAREYRALARRYRQQSELLSLVTDSEPDAIYLLDAEARFRYANRAGSAPYGIAPEDMTGKRLDAIMGPEAARAYHSLHEQALHTKTQITTLHKDPERGTFQVSMVPLPSLPFGEEPRPGVLVVEENVTQIMEEREKQETTLRTIVDCLVDLVDRRDPFAGRHSALVAQISRALAAVMQLSAEMQETAEFAGKLLNIGKIAVPEDMLANAKPLGKKDVTRIREAISSSADFLEGIAFRGPVAETIRQSAERWNGDGPRGLSGDDILITARIIAVANAFVGMISPRAYRPSIAVDEAVAQLMKDAGAAYDRSVVAALVHYLDNMGGRKTLQLPSEAA